MDTTYENFKINDFLKDKSFLMWRLFPEQNSSVFWNNFLDQYPHQKNNLERAIQIMNSVRIENIDLSATDKADLISIYENTKELYQARKYKIRRLYYIATAAACLILFGLLPFSYYQIKKQSNTNQVIAEGTVQNSTKEIQLILGHQDKMLLSQNVDIELNKKREIEITNKKEEQSSSISKIVEKKQINKLIVPKGKRSSLTLPDGTKIWVNSGSSISFPSEFEDNRREISLVDGEIYIEVAKDKTKPFFVNTSFGKILVHGTKFNVTAYITDEIQYIVLAEGSISVYLNNSKELTLSPNQKLNIQNDSCQIDQVNPYEYTCWIDGIMQFSNEQLGNILLRLSRHYGLDIECDELLRKRSCTGKMVLFDNFNEVLNTLSDIFPIQYERNKNEIKISEKH